MSLGKFPKSVTVRQSWWTAKLFHWLPCTLVYKCKKETLVSDWYLVSADAWSYLNCMCREKVGSLPICMYTVKLSNTSLPLLLSAHVPHLTDWHGVFLTQYYSVCIDVWRPVCLCNQLAEVLMWSASMVTGHSLSLSHSLFGGWAHFILSAVAVATGWAHSLFLIG